MSDNRRSSIASLDTTTSAARTAASAGIVSRLEVPARKCRIAGVTVYADRALVERIVDVPSVAANGQTEIVVKNLPLVLQDDSLRVEVVSASAAATSPKSPTAKTAPGASTAESVVLQDVSVKTVRRIDKDETDGDDASKASSAEEQAAKKLKDLRDKRAATEREVAQLKRERKLVDGYASHFGNSAHGMNWLNDTHYYNDNSSDSDKKQPQPGLNVLGANSLSTFQGFLDFYGSKTRALEQKIVELEAVLTTLDAEIENTSGVEHELRMKRLDNAAHHPVAIGGHQQVKEVRIILEPATLSLIENAPDITGTQVSVSYLVSNASWQALYDVRAQSDHNKVSITYMANISQSTGETWDDVRVTLSTASPSTAGDVPLFTDDWLLEFASVKLARNQPMLKSKRVGFSQSSNMANVEMRRANFMVASAPVPQMQQQFAYGGAPGAVGGGWAAADADMADIAAEEEDDDEGGVRAATASQGLTNQQFSLPSTVSIPPDGSPHKFTIGVIKAPAQFKHVAVPRLSTKAYLKAMVTNTSQFALLSGPSSIFLDGSFVAKSKLRNVSPGEEFECSLGVDESIRIDFPAAQKKITASRGLVFATQGVVNISQKITVRNTKQVPVRILVSEQIPSARDDRIKVQLLEPNPRNVAELSAADRAKALIPPATAVDSPYWINPDKKTRLLWSLELKPSQRVTLPVSFEVTHPTSESVAGL